MRMATTAMQILSSTEFWSAIFGAIVGGVIAFFIRWITLREARQQREAEHRRSQQALGHALLFKVLRSIKTCITPKGY